MINTKSTQAITFVMCFVRLKKDLRLGTLMLLVRRKKICETKEGTKKKVM
jgi:hypothetical protein